MEPIYNFDHLTAHLAHGRRLKRVAVTNAVDESTLQAVCRALEAQFIAAIFVGNVAGLRENEQLKAYAERVSFVDAADPQEVAAKAVALVKADEADIIMKGLVNTDVLLRAILHKETGILPVGRVLTHIAVAQLPRYSKLLFFTDAAVIPFPTQEQRMAQVDYVVDLCHRFGIASPKVSLIHCSEKTDARHFPYTEGYAEIIDKGRRGHFGVCEIDGPLDLKTSCDLHSMQVKHIDSPLQGQADALIFPDIEAANVFYKSITLFAGAQTAGILQGTLAPVVLPSRGDDAKSKYDSLALAALI